MPQSSSFTWFAPAERASTDALRQQQALVAGTAALTRALELMPHGVAVLNRQRQIIYANRALAAMLSVEDLSTLVGQRPGEAVGCLHATECVGGCGTTEFCRTCGAARSILSAQQGRHAVEECRIVSARPGGDLDLRIWVRPFEVCGEAFTLFTLADITDEKRRESLERIFFHDVLNTAGNIAGICALLPRASEKHRRDYLQTLTRLSRDLIEEIKAQRDLSAMESGELLVSPATIETTPFLASLVSAYARQGIAAGRTIRIDESPNTLFTSDPSLLNRIIGNMLKNALEACPEDGTVTVGCTCDGDTVRFRVHNPSVMAREVQLQVFQRFFSTKGRGRGLGTYSMKLLSERYLGGRVSFTSSSSEGTTFLAEYPLAAGGAAAECGAFPPSSHRH